jgi:hypothetical protein
MFFLIIKQHRPVIGYISDNYFTKLFSTIRETYCSQKSMIYNYLLFSGSLNVSF